MFRSGRRLFSIASLFVLLVAAAHTSGVFAEPTDARGMDLVASMKDYRLELGLMRPSVLDVQRSLALTMSVFLFGLGVLNLAIAHRDAWVRAGVLPFLSAFNTAWMAALALLYLVYQVPPPLISFALLTLLFAASLRTTRAAASSGV